MRSNFTARRLLLVAASKSIKPGCIPAQLPLYDVGRAYLQHAEAAGNHFQNSKYCMMEMLKGHRVPAALPNTAATSVTFAGPAFKHWLYALTAPLLEWGGGARWGGVLCLCVWGVAKIACRVRLSLTLRLIFVYFGGLYGRF